MELVRGIHSLPVTLDLEDRTVTVHPAAIETDRGVLLVDVPGWPGAIEVMTEHLEAADLALADVWAVVLTHQDVDHVSGLAEVVERVSPVVFAHEACAPYVDGREHPIKMEDDRYPPVSVDVELVEGVRFKTRSGTLEVLHTPGHAPGHVSLYNPDEHLLISGDALHSPEGELEGPRGPLDRARATESIRTLANLNVERTLSHHGGFVEHDPGRIEEIYRAAAEK